MTSPLPSILLPVSHISQHQDGEYLYLNDPAFATAPLAVSHGDFDLAWFERGEVYAVLAP